MPPWKWEAIDRAAESRGISRSEMLRRCVDLHLGIALPGELIREAATLRVFVWRHLGLPPDVARIRSLSYAASCLAAVHVEVTP